MLPTINVLGKEMSMYMLSGVLGALLSGFVMYLMVRDRDDIRKDQLLHIALAAFAGLFVGAHILYGITNYKKIMWVFGHLSIVTESFDNLFYVLNDIFGGMVFYGGLFGGIIGGYWYVKCMKLDFWEYMDIFVPVIPLMHAFGRIGCFMSGCCYGIESEFGFVYHNSIVAEANGVRRLPVQLIECIINLIIVIVLIKISQRGIKKSGVLWIYGILYSIVRFTLEFFRGDLIRGVYLGLSTSQWISIVFFTVSVIMLLKLRSKKDGIMPVNEEVTA